MTEPGREKMSRRQVLSARRVWKRKTPDSNVGHKNNWLDEESVECIRFSWNVVAEESNAPQFSYDHLAAEAFPELCWSCFCRV